MKVKLQHCNTEIAATSEIDFSTGEVREAEGGRWGKQGACKTSEGLPKVPEKETTMTWKSENSFNAGEEGGKMGVIVLNVKRGENKIWGRRKIKINKKM